MPARSGSKRVADKNIRPLSGRPLVIHTLEAFVSLDEIDQVIFSTDSIRYWEIVNENINTEKLVLDYRQPEQSGDDIKIFDYLKSHASQIFDDKNDNFILGLPTSPLRTSAHILDALNLYLEKGKPIFTASKYDFPVSFAFYLDQGQSWLSNNRENPMLTGKTRSQEQADMYHPNGAIYIRKVGDLFSPDLTTLYSGALPYIMNKESSVDIDDEYDFHYAEFLLNAQLKN